MSKRLVIFILGLLVLAMVSTAHARLYRWEDENGKVHYGDRIPPQYSNKGGQELNERGLRLKEIEKPRDPKEVEAEKRAKLLAEEKARREKLQAAQDKKLLRTYGSLEQLEILRNDRVSALNSIIGLAEEKSGDIQKRLLQAKEESNKWRNEGKLPPENMLKKEQQLEQDLTDNNAYLERKKKEMFDLAAKFDKELERFRALIKRKEEQKRLQTGQ